MRRIAATFTLWLWFCALSFGIEPLTLRVTGRLGMAPYTVNIMARIEPHERNRELCLLWGIGEEEMYSVSCQQLDGSTAKRFYQWQRVFREPGEWVVEVTVQRNDGSTVRARDTIRVIGRS